MDMVVYTGGNACSLLSDLISIQGLIIIRYLGSGTIQSFYMEYSSWE